MAVGEFRKDLDKCVIDNEHIDQREDYIALDDAKNILDLIETDIEEIKSQLDNYRNLTEINEIYEMVDKLKDKLY
jgi:hypothetical protein